MTEPDSPAQPSATNEEYEFADEEKGPAEDGTGTLRRRRAPDKGKHGSSGILDEDDSDLEDDIFARDRAMDREACESLLEEEQESFARIKDGHKESRLSKNTLSFIITAPICSLPFNLGAAVIVLKLTLYGLAFFNTRQQPNPLNVGLDVRITQVLAILVASFTQRDVENTVQFVYEGYASVAGHFASDITLWGWCAAVFVALLQGLFGLVAIFELISLSQSVLDVLLNFAAVAVVMKLDVVFFRLAYLGFLGESCQFQTEEVSGTYFRVGHSPRLGYMQKMLLLIAIFLVMLGCWVLIIIRQLNGEYAPRQLVVQFDDSAVPKLGTFSGIYKLHVTGKLLDSDRFHWKQEVQGQGEIGEFGFCKDNKRWTFFLNGTHNKCKDSIVISSPGADEFDPLRDAGSQWFVREDSSLVQGRLIKMDLFTMVPICSRVGTDCGQQNETNTCVHTNGLNANTGYCECQDQQTYGVRCEFSLAYTCQRLNIDFRFGTLPAGRRITSEFSLLSRKGTLKIGNETPVRRDDLVLLYERPVYVGNSFGQDGYDVLFYTGLRWAVTGSLNGFPELHQNKTSVTDQELATYLQHLSEGFNAGFSGHVAQVDVLSEPVSSESQKDSGTPVGLTWVSIEQAAPVEGVKLLNGEKSFASLLCADCNNLTNPCQYEGLCNTASQTCECKHGTKGALCQVQPIGDGSCNPFFNKPSFKFDRGDCCESTCLPSSPYYSGTINDGDLDETFNLRSEDKFVFMGFPNCSDPVIVGNCNENRCWAKGSEITLGNLDESDTYTLSANGRMLLVHRRLENFLAVFDKESSGQWVQRGSDILSIFREGRKIYFDADHPNARPLNFITLPSEVYSHDEGSHVPVWVVFTRTDKITTVVDWDLQSRSWKEYALPLDLAGCVGLNISRSTSYLDLQAGNYTVSDGETSCLYTDITADEQHNFTLRHIINGTSLESNLVDVNNQPGVTMNERLIMVWISNTNSLRVIDYTTEETADVSLPGNCSDGLRSVHLSGRSTRYRYEDDPNEVPRVALECHKESSIYVYVFTINSTITPDELTFTNQPLASLEPLPVPTGEVFKSLAFSDSLLALVFSTDRFERVYVYNGTGCDDERASFRSFGSRLPKVGNTYVSDDGLSLFMNGTQQIEVYTTSPRCDHETQVSLILTTQTTRDSSDDSTFYTVEGRNTSYNVIWSESKGLSGGSGVGAWTILQNEFCINKHDLDHIRIIVNFHRAPFALLHRREVTLNLVEERMYYIPL